MRTDVREHGGKVRRDVEECEVDARIAALQAGSALGLGEEVLALFLRAAPFLQHLYHARRGMPRAPRDVDE
eukprot:COSAG04_NODE_19752_length_409_cov_0.667742_1_plen_70_part_01